MAKKTNDFINVEKLSLGFSSALSALDQDMAANKDPSTWLTRCESYAEHLQRHQFTAAVLPALSVMPVTTPHILDMSRRSHQKHLTAVLEQALNKPEPQAA